MEKVWASGMCSVTRKAKSNTTALAMLLVRATTKSRWGGQEVTWVSRRTEGQKKPKMISLCAVCATGWCFSHEGDEAESLSLLHIMAENPPDWHEVWVDVNAKEIKDKKSAKFDTFYMHSIHSWTHKWKRNAVLWWSDQPSTGEQDHSCCYTVSLGSSTGLYTKHPVWQTGFVLIPALVSFLRSYKINMVDGRTSAWSIISMTLPTCALRDLATESSTGSRLIIRGYVRRSGSSSHVWYKTSAI